MRGSRRRSSKVSPVGVKPAPAAPPVGRFTDQLVQCATCGRTFVFTVEEQRQLADAGLPVEPPTQCPRCAPRAVESSETRVERPQRPVEREDAPPAPPPSRPPVHAPRATFVAPPAPPPAPRPAPRAADEFAGQYTVLSYGHVKDYDPERGVGTLVDDDTSREYRFYHSALAEVSAVTPGQAVEFELNRKGRVAEVAFVFPR